MLTRQINPVNEAEGESGGFRGGMSEEITKEKRLLESCEIHAVVLNVKELSDFSQILFQHLFKSLKYED